MGAGKKSWLVTQIESQIAYWRKPATGVITSLELDLDGMCTGC